MISIVIPTIDGREEWLERSIASFEKRTPQEHEFVVIRNKPVCGIAWNEGIEQAQGDYILLSADDIEPADRYWGDVGIEAVDRGILPCPRILNTDGTLQSCGTTSGEALDGAVSDLARIPFFSREQSEKIYPILEIHYATDYWVTHRGNLAGWPTLVVRSFCFYHHFAPQGRLDNRLMRDMKTFWKAAKLKGEPLPPGTNVRIET